MGVMLLSCCHWVTALFDVDFISIMPKNTPIGGALMWTGAPLDLAAEEVRRRYAGHLNLTVTLLYDEKDRKCDTSDASAPLLLADYYYRQGLNRCLAVMAASEYPCHECFEYIPSNLVRFVCRIYLEGKFSPRRCG